MSPSATDKTPNKLSGALARVLPHLQLDAEARPALAGCDDSLAALDRLEQAGLLIEATRLVAHALPAREAVWWACACSRHTAPSGANPALETTLRDAAEEWVRRPTDEHRRTAMKQAETAMQTGEEPLLALYLWRSENLAQESRLDSARRST